MEWKINPATGQWELVNTGTNMYGVDVSNLNTQTTTSKLPGMSPDTVGKDDILGLSGNQWSTLTNVGGLAMKAMALPSQMDYFKTQTGLAEQQLKSNQQAMADRKTFNQNWANASNSLTGKL